MAKVGMCRPQVYTFLNFLVFKLSNFSSFSLGKVKEMSNFGNSCKENQISSNFGAEKVIIW